MTRQRPVFDLATIKARCPLVVDRPLVTRLQLAMLAAAALAWPLAVVRTVSGWPVAAQLAAGVPLFVGLALLLALARHTYRCGSFRLAADERRLYFREELGGGVRALDWRRCRLLEPVTLHGERALRVEFERHADEGTWAPLSHAQVFLRDTSVEIVAMDLPGASRLVERLEAFRVGAGDGGDDGDTLVTGRAAA